VKKSNHRHTHTHTHTHTLTRNNTTDIAVKLRMCCTVTLEPWPNCCPGQDGSFPGQQHHLQKAVCWMKCCTVSQKMSINRRNYRIRKDLAHSLCTALTVEYLINVVTHIRKQTLNSHFRSQQLCLQKTAVSIKLKHISRLGLKTSSTLHLVAVGPMCTVMSLQAD